MGTLHAATGPNDTPWAVTAVFDLQPDRFIDDSSVGEAHCENCTFRHFVHGLEREDLTRGRGLLALDAVFEALPALLDALASGHTERLLALSRRVGATEMWEIVPPGSEPRLRDVPRLYVARADIPPLAHNDRLLLTPDSHGPAALASRIEEARARGHRSFGIGFLEHAASVEGWAAFCESSDFERGWAQLEARWLTEQRPARMWMAYPPCASLQWPVNRHLEARRTRVDLHFRVLDARASYMCTENVSGYTLLNDVQGLLGASIERFALRVDRLLLLYPQ
jgi:hypothetical protein